MQHCPDCGVEPGSYHLHGCDVENCPRCGHQLISCGCIYEVCGMDVEDIEVEHPDIYTHGPSQEMCEQWDREWGNRRIPWSGEWPGAADARALNLWTKWTDHGWEQCSRTEEGAMEDLNTLLVKARWNVEAQRWLAPN